MSSFISEDEAEKLLAEANANMDVFNNLLVKAEYEWGHPDDKVDQLKITLRNRS